MSARYVIDRIRNSGGSIRVTADGKIAVTKLPDSLRVDLQQNRPEIIQELWKEVRLWPARADYPDSKLALAVDSLYRCAKLFLDNFDTAVEAKELTRLLIEFDNDCKLSHAAALDSFQTNRGRALELVDLMCEAVAPGTLMGDTLRAACMEIFEVIK